MKLNRRQFVQGLASSAMVATALAPVPGTSAIWRKRRPRIAILATEVRKYSHAQHFIDRFLEGYGWHGKHHRPPMELASLYVDQFPKGDLSRERARRHDVRIYPTVAEALTLGKGKLAVDGVLIIAEHGRYPKNEKGQTLYPRYRFFEETMAVFRASGRAVPVFNDKHLSTSWAECVEMVRLSHELDFPFLAGSSLPVTWRLPSWEMPLNSDLQESVCVCYGGVDSYDFHGLETAQCMDERRAGGETGVKWLKAFRGDDVWALLEQRASTRQLVMNALSRSHTFRGPNGFSYGLADLGALRKICSSPVAYLVEHLDGFQSSTFLFNGAVQDFTYACRFGDGSRQSCQMYLPMPPDRATLADFFNPLVNNIEQMILTGNAPYPVERTLLTSGLVIMGVESLHAGGVQVTEPSLQVAYEAPRASTFWRG